MAPNMVKYVRFEYPIEIENAIQDKCLNGFCDVLLRFRKNSYFSLTNLVILSDLVDKTFANLLPIRFDSDDFRSISL